MKAITFERWWPYAVALIISAVWYWGADGAFPANPDGLLAATGTAAAVLVGFLATMNAIILSITGSAVFQQLRAAGYHHDLFRYVYEAIVAGVVFLFVSVLGFFVTETGIVPVGYRIAWMLCGGTALLLFTRVAHLTFKLLKQV